MMANEEEVAGSLPKPAKVTLEGGVPTKDIAEQFGWEFGDVQQRIPSAFELHNGRLVFSDLLLQSQYGLLLGLAIWPVPGPG